MFDKFKNFLGIGAATQVAPVNPPKKLANRQQVVQSYLKTAKPSQDSLLTQTDRRLANKNLLEYRAGSDTATVIRDLAASSPDISAAVNAYLRTAITSSYKAVARNMDGTVSPEGTLVLHQIIANFDVLSDYSLGYADRNSLRSNSEQLGKELLLNGAANLELVLDKTRMPERFQPISDTQIKFYPADGGTRLKPVQRVGGDEINLDVPTFFRVTLDQNLLEAYASSPLESAIQPTLFSFDMLNDLRRVVKRAIHPRLDVEIDEESFRKNIPPDVMYDPEALVAYMNQTISDLESKVNGMSPEDAMVHFSSVGFSIVDHGNTSTAQEWETLQNIANGKMAAGTKAMPTILGQGAASANIASSETLLFLKNADGIIREKLNEIYSRAFTLAVRLYGQDVYVEFAYDPIDLRPANELESFYAMKQSRVLEQLSLGLISDEEASIALTGHLPPAGYEKKSGTGFRANTSVQPAGDGYNGASNDGSALNQSLKPNTPENAKSQNGGKKGN